MRNDFRWKLGLIIALVIASLILLFPPLTARIGRAMGNDAYQGILGAQPIKQGLDLKGGLEVILVPDYRVRGEILDRVGETILNKVGQVNVPAPVMSRLGLEELGKYEGIKLAFDSVENAGRVMHAGVIAGKMTLKDGENEIHLNLKPERIDREIEISVEQSDRDFPADALNRAKVILENRVNGLGLSEPDIRLDDEHDRIIVQLPSVKSEEEAQDILQRTARLNFRIDGRIVMYGDDLKMIKARLDGGQPVLDFEFEGSSKARFAYLTKQYKGKNMAIHLDEEELMNPIIEEPITDGRGIIRMGNASIEETKKFAILMESGSLPISLRNLAVNQVAPTLGKEMIRQSVVAGIAGIVLVVVFMILFYGVMGALADAALMLYALLVLAIMALFRSVLTLPGVAGLILSIGMAVDANIIIFERIKDEIRLGKRVRPAVDAGFKRAFWTIFDSNVTTLIIGGVLLIFGYGAVRGFAVTLSIGILASMFTALSVTKYFLEMLIDRNPDKFIGHFGA